MYNKQPKFLNGSIYKPCELYLYIKIIKEKAYKYLCHF